MNAYASDRSAEEPRGVPHGFTEARSESARERTGLGRPHPAVARIRVAVRRMLTEVMAEQPTADDAVLQSTVLVGLSGGADSLAMTAALAHEAPKLGVHAIAVVVDHGIHDNSAAVSAHAAAQAQFLGLEAVVERVDLGNTSGLETRTLETEARTARYAAFERVLDRFGAMVLLTAHTRDDQAEQVLLGLARGAGARSLSGIPRRRDRFARPLLDITRAETEAACTVAGLHWWSDPANADESVARVRIRSLVLPMLEENLGPGVRDALARTASHLAADADYLDRAAEDALAEGRARAALEHGMLPVDVVLAMPDALRARALRIFVTGVTGQAITSKHIDMVLGLLQQKPRTPAGIAVPGGSVERRRGTLTVTPHPPYSLR